MANESTATRYTLPQLDERTSPVDTDLFLLSDASGVAYKLPYGSMAVKDRSVTTAKLADGAVTLVKISTDAVATVAETLDFLGIEVTSNG